MKLIDYKYKYKSIIKYPVTHNEKTCVFYFRRMTLNEWLEYLNSSSDPIVIAGLLQTLCIEADSEIELGDILEESPGLPITIAKTISDHSDFANYEKARDIFRNAVVLANSPIAYVIQHIMVAFPSYKIEDILNTNADTFLLLAAFAESKQDKPAIVDYLLFNQLYRDEYMSEHNITDEAFNYTYDIHLATLTDEESDATDKIETFVTDSGRVVRGNREEYLRKKAYEREMLRRRTAGLPPISMAKFFANMDIESLEQASAENSHTEDDVSNISALQAKRDLQKKLQQDHDLQLSGATKRKTFSWQNDKDIE